MAVVILTSIPFLVCRNHLVLDSDNLASDNPDFTIEENSTSAINGHSYLNFSSHISPMSIVNATWFTNITVLDSYGVEFFENRSSGLREQIDTNLGNSDNWISESEAESFATFAQTKLNWTDSTSNHCCALDNAYLLPIGEQQIAVIPPEIGPVDLPNSTWGWTESISLRGLTDGRTQRVLDFPRIGEMVEEVPLTVALPEDWEIKFSPMGEIISGSPRNFTVHRSLAPVAYDIRITIGENFPPSLTTQRYPSSMSTISLDKSTSLVAVCTDGFLENPQISWTVEKNGSVVRTEVAEALGFTPSEYGFVHGDPITFSATCTDSHGFKTVSTENLVIDSTPPLWSADIISTDGSTSYTLDQSDGILEVPAGWEITIQVNTSDNMGLPVFIDLFTNITEGWHKGGLNEENFQFTANQGILVNGAHMGLDDRHQQRDESMFAMTLQAMDDAGNTASGNWEIRVTDTMSPTIIMTLESGGINLDQEDGIHYSQTVNASFSESYDDIDAISKLTWGASIDGHIILDDVNWSVIETFELPGMEIGLHELSIWASDSSGNKADSSYQVIVHPKRGVHLTVLETKVTPPTSGENSSSVFVTVQNEGFDKAVLRLCLDDNCTRFSEIPGATIDSRNSSAELQFDLEIINSSSVEGMTLEWDSVSSGTYGQFPIEVNLSQANQSDDGSLIAYIFPIFVISCLIFFAGRRNLWK
tara:strand:+ start:743 stop:2851 length:2109 start_codon:yes stop_codon:yes gene_type:complete